MLLRRKPQQYTPMSTFAVFILMLVSVAGALDVFATQTWPSKQVAQLYLQYEPNGSIPVEPLTVGAGKGVSIIELKVGVTRPVL